VIRLTLWVALALTPKPPKYWDGDPLRECVQWHGETVCCLWRGEGATVACLVDGAWVVEVQR